MHYPPHFIIWKTKPYSVEPAVQSSRSHRRVELRLPLHRWPWVRGWVKGVGRCAGENIRGVTTVLWAETLQTPKATVLGEDQGEVSAFRFVSGVSFCSEFNIAGPE